MSTSTRPSRAHRNAPRMAHSRREAPSMPAPVVTPMLPALFVLVAGHAMESDQLMLTSQDARLQAAAAAVAPIVSKEGLLSRKQDLVGAACDAVERRYKQCGSEFQADFEKLNAALPSHLQVRFCDLVDSVRFDGADTGVRYGLAAGYLLAQLVSGKDGAQ